MEEIDADTIWRHPFGLIYTSSVREFAESKKCYWLIDLVASYSSITRKYPFLLLSFAVQKSHCLFQAREDTDAPILIQQEIDFCDLKESVKLYLCDNTLMFPEDY